MELERNHDVLLRLDALLDEERDALRVLDSRAVVQLAERKAEEEVVLRDVLRSGASVPDAGMLARIQSKAQDNQVLLVHARNCVRAALDVLTGSAEPASHSSRPPARTSVRVDVKG